MSDSCGWETRDGEQGDAKRVKYQSTKVPENEGKLQQGSGLHPVLVLVRHPTTMGMIPVAGLVSMSKLSRAWQCTLTDSDIATRIWSASTFSEWGLVYEQHKPAELIIRYCHRRVGLERRSPISKADIQPAVLASKERLRAGLESAIATLDKEAKQIEKSLISGSSHNWNLQKYLNIVEARNDDLSLISESQRITVIRDSCDKQLRHRLFDNLYTLCVERRGEEHSQCTLQRIYIVLPPCDAPFVLGSSYRCVPDCTFLA